MRQTVNRIIYISFILVGLFSIYGQDYPVAAGLLGLAILFDPFDIRQSWSDKPSWQRAVFAVQGIMVIGLFIPWMVNFWSNW